MQWKWEYVHKSMYNPHPCTACSNSCMLQKSHLECTKLTKFEFVTAVNAANLFLFLCDHHVHKTFCQQNQSKHRAVSVSLHPSHTLAYSEKGSAITWKWPNKNVLWKYKILKQYSEWKDNKVVMWYCRRRWRRRRW